MKRCKVDGCDLRHSAKGFCNKHYQRKIKSLPMEVVKRTVEQRIFDSVIKGDSCWLWTGARSGGNGDEGFKYGYIRVNNKSVRVHRLVYEIFNKVKLGDELILHSCDTPLCVNPEHLFIGTYYDNNHDCIDKDRTKHPHGEYNHSKLSNDDVLKVRKMRKNGDSYAYISTLFPVCVSHIRKICLGEKWKHLPL